MNGNPFYEPYWDTELEHHGVKNMKWGVKNGPPYPLDKGKDGRVTKTQKKKKASFLARLRGEGKKKETKKKEDDIPRSKKEQEKIRKKALASTDPKYIYKYRKLLTDDELQDRINRINKEESIKKLIPKEKDTWDKIANAKKFMQETAAMAESVKKVYETYDTVITQQQNRENLKRTRQEQAETRASQRREQDEVNRSNRERRAFEQLQREAEQRRLDNERDEIDFQRRMREAGLDYLNSLTPEQRRRIQAEAEQRRHRQNNQGNN